MELVVGVPTSFATAWLIPRLDFFRKANTDIELRLDTSGSPVEKLGDSLDMIIFFAEEGAEKVLAVFRDGEEIIGSRPYYLGTQD